MVPFLSPERRVRVSPFPRRATVRGGALTTRLGADDPLLARLRAGDEQTFEALFHAEYDALCGFAYRLVRSAPVAEDVVQGVFLRLWSARGQLRGVQSVRAYLYRSTRNAALDHLKHAAVEARWEETAAAEDAAAAAPPDAQRRLEGEERARALHDALGRLPPRAREVVTLRWLRGLSPSEIATALDISVKGVEIQITRALRTLRAHLGSPGP